MDGASGRISALRIYPVKGCRGIALSEALLEPRGLAHDRRWMIVTADGRFRTQREIPLLATITATIEDGRLRLSGAAGEVTVPVADDGEPTMVTVWRDRVAARRPDPAVDAALSEWLCQPVGLVRFPEATRRSCDPAHAGADDHTGFADGFPLLVTSEASLVELNDGLLERGESPVPMERFRPNLVIDGASARSEDRYRRVEFDGAALRLVKPCDRCIVTTTDQHTGERDGREPLATLMRIRRNPETGGAWFGQNAVPELPLGSSMMLRVGQSVRLA